MSKLLRPATLSLSLLSWGWRWFQASAKYPNVENLIMRINVAPSSKIGKWTLCSHPGLCSEHHPNGYPEVLKVRWVNSVSSLYMMAHDLWLIILYRISNKVVRLSSSGQCNTVLLYSCVFTYTVGFLGSYVIQ